MRCDELAVRGVRFLLVDWAGIFGHDCLPEFHPLVQTGIPFLIARRTKDGLLYPSDSLQGVKRAT